MGPCSIIAMAMAGFIATEPTSVVVHDGGYKPVQSASDDDVMRSTLQELTPRFMAFPGVVGVGEGRCDGKPCIKVLVVEKTEDLVARIQDVAGDEPVDIVETGEIRAREELE